MSDVDLSVEGAPVPPGGLGRRSSMGIAAASFAGALAGYVVLAVVARSVTLAENAIFVTFWAALLTTYGVVTGVNTETARSVAQARVAAAGRSVDAGAGPGASRVASVLVVVPLVVLGLGVLAATVGLHPFDGEHHVLGYVAALSAAVYTGEAVLLGALSGRASWNAYSGLLLLEAGARVLLVGIAAFVAATVVGVAVAAASAAAVWVLMLVISPAARGAVTAPLDEPLRPFLRRAALAAVAAGASGVLLVGFPVMVSATTPAPVYATAAPLMLAISLTRAPIMVPLTAFQSVIVSHFVRSAGSAARSLVTIVLGVLAVGAVGAGAAYLVGPAIMALLFGEDYRVSGAVLATMTFASAGTAVITVTAALCQALRSHVAFVLGWLVALAVTLAFLLGPGEMQQRVLLALVVAPYAGAIVHVVAIVRRRARSSGIRIGAAPVV